MGSTSVIRMRTRCRPPRHGARVYSISGAWPKHYLKLQGAPIVQIEAVDFFYLSMPEVTLEGDGSQDALLVRVAAGGEVGWGECEASPLVSIAAAVCPRSHGAC